MHLLRLIRPVNLAIIAISMYGVLIYLYSLSPFIEFNHVDFALLVFSTLLIAAAGNIINDYFDVRADRVNRPKRLIISKHIKARWAIALHWMLNLVAFFIAGYLSWKYNTFWFSVIHVTSITLLWWYSVKLKKIPLLGNIVISGLTVLVIYLTLIFIDVSNSDSMRHLLASTKDPLFEIASTWIILIFMWMAFFQNLMREIVKDGEDMEGDKLIHAKTIPMILGLKTTLHIIGFALVLFPIGFFLGVSWYFPNFNWNLAWPISIAAVLNGIGFVISFSSSRKSMIQLKTILKLTMFAGLIYLFQYI